MALRLLCAIVLSLLLGFMTNSYLLSPLFTTLPIYLLLGGYLTFKNLVHTFPRDLKLLVISIKTEIDMRKHVKNKTLVHQEWLKLVIKHPHKIAIRFEDQVWTYEQLNNLTNQIAHHLSSTGVFENGDSISLVSENCPQYLAITLAISKIGCSTSLINFNLKPQSLLHCIKLANSKSIIVASNLIEGINEIYRELPENMLYCSLGPVESSELPGIKDLYEACKDNPTTEPNLGELNVKSSDPFIYINTSGTTGLPKACKFSHMKYIVLVQAFSKANSLVPNDIMYITLPMYHTNGLVLGSGQALIMSREICIRKKFSASNFWTDCIRYKCTAFIYIGELCRYLLAQPQKPTDTQHQVRLAVGNGLRNTIWKGFQSRFQINSIHEFYGATEGNCNTINPTGKTGSCGVMLITFKNVPILRKAYEFTQIIKIDPDTGEPLRDTNGLCIKCGFNEPGEMCGSLVSGNISKGFEGYVNQQATNKKMIKDVITKGDNFFRTGDILIVDDQGYLYFQDRSGDTFRWKGENVSTTEIESILAPILGSGDAVVYGVEIPGYEGKAGMAGITKNDVEWDHFSDQIRAALPSYAVPLFIRVLGGGASMTETFKYRKVDLKKVGYNLDLTSDSIYFLHPSKSQYVLLTREIYQEILDNRIRQ